ncbi:hypothetical protein LOTGIDRAFT_153370 [Lottia gigantea]|uniref:Uncharacterized protein n=1 Tax=Lottia gigantea TaxID=225164 RepID=V4AAU6_LOTGI|nr:hypothetical protein LOTGIDRAFT_153370 [Lottia gigantea]ESO93897.1 hypothetical protein LOTGIDRAFT_153370 [Lottia gigantea]
MATESDISTLFQNLTGELIGLSTTLKHHGVSHLVDHFAGDPKHYSDWIKSIQKYALLADIPDAKIKYIAYQTSSSTVSDFLARYLPEHAHSSWGQVKRELATRFDTITDAQHALVILQTARVRKMCKSLPNDGTTTKSHAEDLRLANIENWEIPKPDDDHRHRNANYVVTPESSSDSSSDGSATEDDDLFDLVKASRHTRANSSSEDDIPLMELANRIRATRPLSPENSAVETMEVDTLEDEKFPSFCIYTVWLERQFSYL